jgi:hypothetical protein
MYVAPDKRNSLKRSVRHKNAFAITVLPAHRTLCLAAAKLQQVAQKSGLFPGRAAPVCSAHLEANGTKAT